MPLGWTRAYARLGLIASRKAKILEVGPDPDSSHRRVTSPDSTDAGGSGSGSGSESFGLGPDTLESGSSPGLRRFIYPYLVILRTCT